MLLEINNILLILSISSREIKLLSKNKTIDHKADLAKRKEKQLKEESKERQVCSVIMSRFKENINLQNSPMTTQIMKLYMQKMDLTKILNLSMKRREKRKRMKLVHS